MDKKWKVIIIILSSLMFVLLVSFISVTAHIYAKIDDEVEYIHFTEGLIEERLDGQLSSIEDLEDFKMQTEGYYSDRVFINVKGFWGGYEWTIDGKGAGSSWGYAKSIEELVAKENIPNIIGLNNINNNHQIFKFKVDKDKVRIGDMISAYAVSPEIFQQMTAETLETLLEFYRYDGEVFIIAIRHLDGSYETPN